MATPTDYAATMRQHRATRAMAGHFYMEFPTPSDDDQGETKANIFANVKQMKQALATEAGKGANNTHMLEYLLRFWEQHHYSHAADPTQNQIVQNHMLPVHVMKQIN